jgi:hypothetical protein
MIPGSAVGSQTGSARRVGVVLLLVAGSGRDGVEELPVGECVAVPAEVRGQIVRRLHHPGDDDKPQVRLIQLAQNAC